MCNVFPVELAATVYPDAQLESVFNDAVRCGWSNEDGSSGVSFGATEGGDTCAQYEADSEEFRNDVEVGVGGCGFWLITTAAIGWTDVYWQQADGTWFGVSIQDKNSTANRLDDAIALARQLSERLG